MLNTKNYIFIDMKLQSLIKPNVNETSAKATKAFNDVLSHLRSKVYPKLNDDDLYDLNVMIRDYFKKNV